MFLRFGTKLDGRTVISISEYDCSVIIFQSLYVPKKGKRELK